MYRHLVYPLLCRFDAEWTHEKALHSLARIQNNAAGRALLKFIAGTVPDKPVTVAGVTFPNVLGVAAGFDKEVIAAKGLWQLGFGHVEVGTLTPRRQAGNPRPRIFRLVQHQAIINRMGFPNCGVEAALPRLEKLIKLPHRGILGVSLGKQKETALEDAASDYVEVMQKTWRFADYLAVNISSPNTPGLRELQGGRYLETLLTTLTKALTEFVAQAPGAKRPPLFVKIAPDLSVAELGDILSAVTAANIDGIIAANTTLDRSHVESHPLAKETGGLSGLPARSKSTALIREIRRLAGPTLPIIGVGGIFSAQDAREKMEAGANLLQVYTGLVYEGPGMAGQILRELP